MEGPVAPTMEEVMEEVRLQSLKILWQECSGLSYLLKDCLLTGYQAPPHS